MVQQSIIDRLWFFTVSGTIADCCITYFLILSMSYNNIICSLFSTSYSNAITKVTRAATAAPNSAIPLMNIPRKKQHLYL